MQLEERVDHAEAFGRIAFSCPNSEVCTVNMSCAVVWRSLMMDFMISEVVLQFTYVIITVTVELI